MGLFNVAGQGWQGMEPTTTIRAPLQAKHISILTVWYTRELSDPAICINLVSGNMILWLGIPGCPRIFFFDVVTNFGAPQQRIPFLNGPCLLLILKFMRYVPVPHTSAVIADLHLRMVSNLISFSWR